MIDSLQIRPVRVSDGLGLRTLYGRAFPDEDLLSVVDELHDEGSSAVSLVSTVETEAGENAVVGHAVFTPCRIDDYPYPVALLGPLAVLPDYQRHGVGSALVRAGLKHMDAAGITQVYVLGDPAYYGRFGFEPETRIAPPYPLPEEWRGAWQSLSFRGDTADVRGTLMVPSAWRRRGLWAP